MYANYHFQEKLNGLSLGAGVYYIGERPVNYYTKKVTKQGVVPGQKPSFNLKAYTTVNAQASYQFSKHWDFRFLLNNIFNKIGYTAYKWGDIYQTEPTSFYGILSYRF